jgi:hypothetical protein
MWKRIPDNFLLGCVLGGSLLYLSTHLIDTWRTNAYGENVPAFWHEPKPELIALLLNIFLFRISIRRHEKTAQGILFITVVMVIAFYFFKARHFGS